MSFGYTHVRRTGMNGIVDDISSGGSALLDVIAGKAKAGAESAIPEIQAQVQAVVEPYVIAAIALGLGGFLFGLSAFLSVRKAKRTGELRGARRR